MRKNIVIMLLIMLFPLNVLAYSEYIIPGGENIGIEVNNKGIIIVGFYKIDNKYNINDLKIGDIIEGVNNIKVKTIEEMVAKIEENVIDDKVVINILRNKKKIDVDFELIKVDNIYKTGLYVKDSISGIGTLTYIDPETKKYGALGHEIIESNTLLSVEVRSGSIYESKVTSIDRSSTGSAGTKNAKLYSSKVYGNIKKNTISGIYGDYVSEFPKTNTLKVGNPDDLVLGKAYINTVIDGEKVEQFEINITKISKDTTIKNIYFEVTDETLKRKTGGIVQGMSGSPIIQDNKIFGAVTHVIISNPTTGYGIFITTMLEEGER